MPDNNFNRAALRDAAAIDLGERAAARKRLEEMQAAAAANPWNQIDIVIQEIPNSCLYEIYSGESLAAQQKAQRLGQAVALGNAPLIAAILGINFDGPMPRDWAQGAMNLAYAHITMNVGIAQQKAQLALAAATMAQLDFDRGRDTPDWHGPDGTLGDGSHAKVYLDKKLAQKAAQIPDEIPDEAPNLDANEPTI